jgi:hypothetical protein
MTFVGGCAVAGRRAHGFFVPGRRVSRLQRLRSAKRPWTSGGPLSTAISLTWRGGWGSTRTLLEARTDNYALRTPLQLASQAGQIDLVCWLLDHGADLHARDPCGATALFFACYRGRPSVLRLLLERGGDPTTAQVGKTPLMSASAGGHLEIVRILLANASAKATLNHRETFSGKTALYFASYWGHWEVVWALLESGTDHTIPDRYGITPMALAKQEPEREDISVEGRRVCISALEVRL